MTTNKSVLLVDDDLNFVNLYSIAFKQKNINFSVANRGSQALEKVKLENPDLVLLDIMMPDIDGFMVLQKIKQDPQTKGIIIWMLTNLGENAVKDKALSSGAAEYIIKATTTPLALADKILQFFASNQTPVRYPSQI